MILHFINNGLQTLLLFFAGDTIEQVQDQDIKPEILQIALGVIFSCFLCYFLIRSIIHEVREKDDNKNYGDLA